MSGPELVIHGHFYQPPRENPWTEEVGRERSAAPWHDWNDRIATECYRPNAVARVVDDEDRVVAVVDNYANISYNVGPTLLSWMERAQPEVYRRVVDADVTGNGAIAQAFGHTILPLATEEDVRLQVRWGLADFRYRFGREALGMWLPECAVNDMVLRVLAEEGVQFTILAPGQAAQIRSLEGTHDWVDVHHAWFDTSRPYRWNDPRGTGIGLQIFFYNGPLSHAVAFEMSGLDSQGLVDRMVAAGSGRVGLVTLAADGETFGHHHRYGDRLLAYALEFEAPSRGFPHTNFNDALGRIRPTHEVRVHESAWSCAHGVGRWREDCGCSTGGGAGWNQRWRAPLRSALDQLRATVAEVTARRGAGTFSDVVAARLAYVDVLIGATSEDAFAAEHIVGDPIEAFTIMEAERHAQSMFTSCGWFFNDLAGIETIQVLRYAARVIDLLVELGEPSPLGAFLAILGEARSNDANEGTGLEVWLRHVEPARVDAARAVRHVALAEVLTDPVGQRVGPYEVVVEGRRRDQRGNVVLATGLVIARHRRTGRTWRHAYAVLGLGGFEVTGCLYEDLSPEIAADAALHQIREMFAAGAHVPALLAQLSLSGSNPFDLSAALPDDREHLMRRTADALAERYADAYERLYETHRATVEDLVFHGYELPPVLRAPAELALARRFATAVSSAGSSVDPNAYSAAVDIARQARAAGFVIDTPSTTAQMEKLVLDAVRHAVERPSQVSVDAALEVLALKEELRAPARIDQAQEAVYFALEADRGAAHAKLLQPLAKALFIRVD